MNVRLRYDLPFTAGVYHNGNFAMNNYSLRLWMATVSDQAEDQTTAFERLKYFVYTCMENTVFIDAAQTEQCDKFLQAGLHITTMPGEPVDQLIGIMLYYKLNAVMENRMIVIETELSSALGEYMTYLHCEEENTVGYVQPDWWVSPDLVHNNIESVTVGKVVAIPHSISWQDIGLEWADDIVDEPAEDTTGNIVVFADFKNTNETK